MYNWDLSNIYTSIESEEFKKDTALYEEKTAALNNWCAQNLAESRDAAEKAEEYIKRKNELCIFSKLIIFVQLSLSTDSTNEKLAKAMDKLEAISAGTSIHEALFGRFIASIDDIDRLINSSDVLKEHEFFLTETRSFASHMLSVETEKAIAGMKTTGSFLWKKQWEQITSTLKNKVIVNGEEKELTLTMLRNLAYDADAKTRKAAYEAELEAYKKIELAGAFAMNGIKGEVINEAKMRGYSSPLEMTLQQSRMNSDVLDAMFGAIKKKIPMFTEYFRKKAEYLGEKNGLPFYDLFAPVGASNSQYTYEDAQRIITDAFSSFSKRMGDFAKLNFEKHRIDVYPHEGKAGGAFCEVIHPIKESRILTNFSGSFNDVVTIAHELGHAFHDSHLYDTSELNAFYPMPIAETASTFCETIINKYVFSSLSDEEKIFVLEKDISEAAQTIVDIYSRFLFEKDVFGKREDGFISSAELCNMMERAQLEAYGDGLDKDFTHRYMWLCKCHYYDADFNFYNFPYAFGVLLSKGLYGKYLDDKENFPQEYSRLLEASSTNDLISLLADFGIDITAEKFWSDALNVLEGDIAEFIQIIKTPASLGDEA